MESTPIFESILKGYQWPFDVNKIKGSSIIDLLVYYQTRVLGRRVYMDFMHNPSSLEPDFPNVPPVAKSYLENSSALVRILPKFPKRDWLLFRTLSTPTMVLP